MSRLVKKFGLIFAALLVVLSSVTFMTTKASAATAGEDPITIGTIKNTSAIPAVMAEVGHEYKSNNLNVQVKTFDSNKELNDAIAQGTVNVAASNLVSYATLTKKNPDWKIAGTLPGYYGLVANKKFKSVKKLKGKTIALDKSDMSKMYLKNLLKKNKMKLSSVKLLQVDSEAERVTAIKDGRANAAVLEDTSISEAKANGDKLLNRQGLKKNNGNVLLINKKFSSKNTSSTQILVRIFNSEIKTINDAGTYMVSNNAFRQLNVSDKAVGKLNDMEVEFNKIKQVKKSDFNKAFKYAKSQKLYKGKIKYKKSLVTVKKRVTVKDIMK